MAIEMSERQSTKVGVVQTDKESFISSVHVYPAGVPGHFSGLATSLDFTRFYLLRISITGFNDLCTTDFEAYRTRYFVS